MDTQLVPIQGHKVAVTNPPADINTMTVREFIDFGYLQELNRTFLAPLGIIMKVSPPSDENNQTGELNIFDLRMCPEKALLSTDLMDDNQAKNVSMALDIAGSKRLQMLGFIVQPMPGDEKTVA